MTPLSPEGEGLLMQPPQTETSPGPEASQLEPGSFRDPESRVFYAGDGV